MLKKIRGLFGRRSPKDANTESESPVVHHGPQVVHQTISPSDLDPDAVKILERLTRFDHNAYLVGGCVRDLLLDRHPKDFDIATSATPRQIKRVFRNCRIIGRRFRLAHIYFQNGKIIEVATFRSANADFSGTGGRDKTDGDGKEDLMIRDDNVFGTPEEDALRRDFTINSLFYELNNETVLDHANGLDDLRRRLVRTIGDPSIRFSEDPIRILRAIKFAGRLDFGIEAKTLEALRERACEIPKAAAPRILEEINRFGREGHALRCFELLREYGVFEVILPELEAPYRRPEAWELLNGLLAGIDRRSADGQFIQTGEILAALLLPVLAEDIGWKANGTVELPKGLELRNAIDSVLRPLALRLRVSRREQERCRQIIAILARMVPVERVRKSTRRTLLRRINFLEALFMLEILGGHYGNEFDAAFEAWKGGAEEAETRRDARTEDSRPSTGEDGEPTARRRRRRGSDDDDGGGGVDTKKATRGRNPNRALPPRTRPGLRKSPPPSPVERDGRAGNRQLRPSPRRSGTTIISFRPFPARPSPGAMTGAIATARRALRATRLQRRKPPNAPMRRPGRTPRAERRRPPRRKRRRRRTPEGSTARRRPGPRRQPPLRRG